MKAITTRYKGPTDTRGSRIVASEPDGRRLTIPYPSNLSAEDAHRLAAEALRDRLEWKGELAQGWIGAGYVFVFADHCQCKPNGTPTGATVRCRWHPLP